VDKARFVDKVNHRLGFVNSERTEACAIATHKNQSLNRSIFYFFCFSFFFFLWRRGPIGTDKKLTSGTFLVLEFDHMLGNAFSFHEHSYWNLCITNEFIREHVFLKALDMQALVKTFRFHTEILVLPLRVLAAIFVARWAPLLGKGAEHTEGIHAAKGFGIVGKSARAKL